MWVIVSHMYTKAEFEVTELGYFHPNSVAPMNTLVTDAGYLVASIKVLRIHELGYDYFSRKSTNNLTGYKPVQRMVCDFILLMELIIITCVMLWKRYSLMMHLFRLSLETFRFRI